MKDVIDVLELQGQREKISRKLVDYRHFDGSYVGIRFLFECGMDNYNLIRVKTSVDFDHVIHKSSMIVGMKAGCRPQTITTAAYIFHKFFKETDIKNYDIYVSNQLNYV